jgi:putative drug exporter of the RND superfamily
MRSLGSWCFRHRLVVVGLWVAAVIAAMGIHHAVGSNYSNNFTLPNTQSSEAIALLQRTAPKDSGDTDQLVVAVNHGKVTDAGVKARMDHLLKEVAKLPHVTVIGSPYATGNAKTQVAPSGQIAFATITFNEGAANFPGTEATDYDKLISSASGHGVSFAVDGQVAEDGDPSGSTAGIPVGFIAAGVVLFLVFGTLFATLLPLLTAGAALGVGLAVVGILSTVINVASFSGQLALLIGMGVGVDYALFIVTRYRQGLLRGLEREEAVLQALDTSGRAVMFAGIIVCVAMLGMFLLGVSFLYGVAIAAAITVAFTVIAALTLLPAMLSLFGGQVLRRRERRALAENRLTTTDESVGWGRWAAILTRRPVLLAALATIVMVVLALPFFSMRLGTVDAGSDPPSTTTYQAYHLLAKGFGAGYNGPLQLVAEVSSKADRQEFTAVVDRVAHTAGVVRVAQPTFTASNHGVPGVALANVFESGSPQAGSTQNLLSTLRNQVIPAALGNNSLQVLVGGQTAIFVDFAAVLTAKLPLFVGIVVLVSSLLLMMLFRSIAIPLTAAIMNLLSTLAALGVVTAVFQFGWVGSLIGITPGPIEAFVPVLLFPILFGLSMDYEVFLVCRIHEEWHRRRNNTEAVSHGLAATGKTITAAAVIMVLVFAAFVLSGQRVIELFGIGLASAVFLDAMIVRSVVVPATMLLLGHTNWKLPEMLDRTLPRIHVERPLHVELPHVELPHVELPLPERPLAESAS